MTVQEMHIEINQATQSIAANVRRKLYPEEIDWILNKTVRRYIGTHSGNYRDNPSAADSLMHLQRLSTLLESEDIVAYRVGDEFLVESVLPFKVNEILSAQAAVHNLCGRTANTLRDTKHLLILPVKQTIASSQFYKNVTLSVDGTIRFNMQAYAVARNTTFNGFQAKTERWRLLNIMLPELASLGYEVHWETYGELYKPGCIIFSGLGALSTSIDIDGTVTNGTIEEVLETQFVNTDTAHYPCRLYFQSVLPQMSSSAFASTYYRSPLCYVQQDKLRTQVSSSFIVSGIRLHYVRKPRPIDINLNENCELPESVHTDICDLAIEYIKGLRADPDWENKLRDNMTRTTI